MGYRGSRGFDRSPRKMHKTVCADCGKECEVPFQPKRDRPVYCRECFVKRKPQRTENHPRREYRRENRQRRSSLAPENINLQILKELKRIRKILEKGTT